MSTTQTPTRCTCRDQIAGDAEAAMIPALEMIARERSRQQTDDAWTPAHDDRAINNELALAAACYVLPVDWRTPGTDIRCPEQWPWRVADWKPTRADRIRELVKAAALLVAEIERLQRAARDTALTDATRPAGR